MLSIDDVVKVRPGAPSDLAYVYSTWLRDLRRASGDSLPDDIWFPAHREYINRVLADPQVELTILCAADAPREILGYVVAEPSEILHWIQIKPKFRGQHLTKLLLSSARATRAVAAWATPDSRLHLKNPRRPRQVRLRYQRASE